MKSKPDKLREGFTTGSAATAAAMAALRHMFTGSKQETIEIPLPVKGTLTIPVAKVEKDRQGIRGIVIKDGGDDPDATHGEEIHALVQVQEGEGIQVHLNGGKGVGRVTRPGLPVAVGEAAINPAPQKQIISGLLQELSRTAPNFRGTVKVDIEVPRGEEIAKQTMNARLGILGGISILGTQGIVRPFSHASWKASIAQSLSVARAAGHNEIVFTTGRRSESFYADLFPATPPVCMIQAADFFKFSMLQAKAKQMQKVSWSLFIGKLVKHAQGFPYTHARDWAIDFPLLAAWIARLGTSEKLTRQIRNANTARQVFKMLPDEFRRATIEMLISKAELNAVEFAGQKSIQVEYILFDFDGKILFPAQHQT